MTKTEMKKIMVDKFKDEGCSFRSRDIKIDGNIIIIKDYEHIRYEVTWEEDDDIFGTICYINERWRSSRYDEEIKWSDESNLVVFVDSKTETKDEMLKEALVQLAYDIASTF